MNVKWNSKLFSKVLFGAVALFVGLLFLNSGEKSSVAPRQELSVGYLPISPAIPLFIAKERGLFEAQGLTVNLVKYQNGAMMAEDVITGRIDAASPGPADVYLTKEIQTPGRFRIYLQTAYTPDNFIYSILVRKNSDIEHMSDLKGKRIAVFPGVTNSLLCGLALKRMFGWEPGKDVELKGVSPPLQLDALQTGEFDALCPLEPIGTIGEARDALVMLDKGLVEREVLNPLYITAHALSTKAIKENEKGIDKFVHIMEAAAHYARTNDDEARRILVKYTPLNLALAQKAPLGDSYTVADANHEQFQKLADLLLAEGVLAKPIDVTKLYYQAK